MIVTLLKKELTLELRRKSVLFGIGVYLISLIFITYLTFSLRHNQINEATWSALFWITILFVTINSVAKSFIGERKGLSLYYYTIASAQAVLISKILSNTILSFALSLCGYFLFATLIYNPIEDHAIFIVTLLLTSIGFSAALTLLSAIASRANNSHVIHAILSFPVLLSVLLMAIRITKNLLDQIDPSASYDELLNLLAINSILTGLACVLFPYIWRS